jgi:hypothetical protein
LADEDVLPDGDALGRCRAGDAEQVVNARRQVLADPAVAAADEDRSDEAAYLAPVSRPKATSRAPWSER